MKTIKVHEANREKITAAIDENQKRTTARNITTDDVFRAINMIEYTLNIKKKDLDGIKASCDIHAQNFPNAYKYRAESTQFTIENRRGTWYLTDIMRYYTRRDGHTYKLQLTEAAKRAIIERRTTF